MTPKTQSVCKHCQKAIRLTTTVDIPEMVWLSPDGAVFCPKFAKPTGHEPEAEPASTGEPQTSERTLYLRNHLACDGCGREKYFAGNKKWLHSHSNIEMCDDEDCKKFEEMQPSAIAFQASPKEVAEQSAEPPKINGFFCPKCQQPLKEIRYPVDCMLNRDQWESQLAGDLFCTCHNNGRGHEPNAYFWKYEFTEPAAPQPVSEADDPEHPIVGPDDGNPCCEHCAKHPGSQWTLRTTQPVAGGRAAGGREMAKQIAMECYENMHITPTQEIGIMKHAAAILRPYFPPASQTPDYRELFAELYQIAGVLHYAGLVPTLLLDKLSAATGGLPIPKGELLPFMLPDNLLPPMMPGSHLAHEGTGTNQGIPLATPASTARTDALEEEKEEVTQAMNRPGGNIFLRGSRTSLTERIVLRYFAKQRRESGNYHGMYGMSELQDEIARNGTMEEIKLTLSLREICKFLEQSLLPAAPGSVPQAPDPLKDDLRCAICCWPLAESAEKGCVRGNCSMRPFPEVFYDLERANREYGNKFGVPARVPQAEPPKEGQ